MPSYTIYADTSDGSVRCTSTTYSSARAGTGTLSIPTDNGAFTLGQLKSGSNFIVNEVFVSFDLSAVAGSASSAVLSLYIDSDLSATDFTLEARESSWSSGGLQTSDFVAGADLGSLTLLASLGSASFSTPVYNALSSEAALLTAVDLHGTLDILFASSRTRGGNTPTGNEHAIAYSASETGTSRDPKIDITTVEPGNPWNYYAQLQ